MKIAIGSDHAGFGLKSRLISWLQSRAGGHHLLQNAGCFSDDSCDYPDFARAVGQRVGSKRAARGILLCGTGIGMSMAANKIRGVRAAVAWNPAVAALAAEHNQANVICLPARSLTLPRAKQIIRVFLQTPFAGGRHARRVRKINQLERCP